jgi:hypothetical protein
VAAISLALIVVYSVEADDVVGEVVEHARQVESTPTDHLM